MHAFTTDELTVAMDQLHGVANAVRLEFLRMLDHLDRIEGWREDGATSLENWLSYRYAMTWESARDHVAVMRAIRDLPAIASAFGIGALSWEVLVLLCSFVVPEEDEHWADRARRWGASAVRRHARAVRRVSREDAARLDKKRSLTASWDASGDFLRLSGLIPGAEGVMVKKTLDRIADEFGPDQAGIFAPYEQRLADALVELAGARVAADSDPDRATVVVNVDARELALVNGTGVLPDGPRLASEVIRRLGCDARLQMVVRDVKGTAIQIGPLRRSVPAWVARELRTRDGGCVICGRSSGNHAHHVKHWAHGGRTELDNLVLLCRRCHRLVHEGGFRLVRDRHGDVKLIRPDGRPVASRPAPVRPEVRERFLGRGRARVPAMRC